MKPTFALCKALRSTRALALESQTSINKLKAPSAYQQSSKCMKTSIFFKFFIKIVFVSLSRAAEITCPTCPTWSHFIQDKLTISGQGQNLYKVNKIL